MTPTLVLTFGLREADRLRRYAAGRRGGWQLLAARIFATTRPAGQDGRYRAQLSDVRDLAAFARQREGSGGWQSLLRKLRPTLVTYDAAPLTQWPAIRQRIVATERATAGRQLPLACVVPTLDDLLEGLL